MRLKKDRAVTASAAPREDHRTAEGQRQDQYDRTDSPFSDSSPYTSPFLVHHPDGAVLVDETSGSSVYPELSFAFAKEADPERAVALDAEDFPFNFNGQNRLKQGYCHSHSHAQAQSHAEAKSKATAQAQATKRALLQLLPPEKRSFAFAQPLNFAENNALTEKDKAEGDLPLPRPTALRLTPSADLEDDDVPMQQEQAAPAAVVPIAVAAPLPLPSNAVSASSSLSTSFYAVAASHGAVKSGPLPTSRKRSTTSAGGNRRVTRGVARRQKAVADGVDDDDTITIGEYTKAERRRKIARFLEKRQRRKWTHGLMLKCRQVFATNRPRVNGRFVVLPKAICPLIAKGVDMRGYDLSRPQPAAAVSGPASA